MSKSSERVLLWRKETKQKLVNCMGGCCQVCKYNKTNKALSFHHLDSTKKDFNISSATVSPLSWKKIVEEVKKCILVCHNCHAEIHDGITEIPKTFCSFVEPSESAKEKFNPKCISCGNSRNTNSKSLCGKCYVSPTKITWPEKETLLEMKKTLPITKIGLILGVSDNAVRKHLKKNNILW